MYPHLCGWTWISLLGFAEEGKQETRKTEKPLSQGRERPNKLGHLWCGVQESNMRTQRWEEKQQPPLIP